LQWMDFETLYGSGKCQSFREFYDSVFMWDYKLTKCPVNLDHLQERYGIADSIKVQELEKEKRNEIIVSCLEIGTGLRQLSRLTGVTYGVINKLNKGR
jgi:hypothetical protein